MQDFESSPPPPPPKGNSTWKWLAIGCGGCLGISILLIAGLTFVVSRTMKFAIEPEEVETGAQELFSYEIPGGSQGILQMNLFGVEIIQVGDTQSPPQVLITMGRIPSYLRDEQTKEAFLEGIQEGMADGEGYQLSEQRVEPATACDQAIELVVREGVMNQGGETIPAVSYLFNVNYNDSNRFAWVLTNGPEAEATAQVVFDSLECQ